MSFIKDREADIKRKLKIGKFKEPLKYVEQGETILGIMNSWEKAIYSLLVDTSIDYAENKEIRHYQLMMYWSQLMYLEICERLRIWDKPMTVKAGFKIVQIRLADQNQFGDADDIEDWPCPN